MEAGTMIRAHRVPPLRAVAGIQASKGDDRQSTDSNRMGALIGAKPALQLLATSVGKSFCRPENESNGGEFRWQKSERAQPIAPWKARGLALSIERRQARRSCGTRERSSSDGPLR